MNANVAELRPRMMSVAYRMLGSVADAEDAVQDAFLRLHSAPEVASPEGFLVKTTTRRCIDRLRAHRRRKSYVGPWVPEPVDTKSGVQNGALADSLSQVDRYEEAETSVRIDYRGGVEGWALTTIDQGNPHFQARFEQLKRELKSKKEQVNPSDLLPTASQ